MKLAVMGAGAVGGYFGARLAAAGDEVHFVARGAQLEALVANGIQLKSAIGDLHLQRVQATADPATVGSVDVVIFTVKQFDTAPAALACKTLLGENTTVITLQNGMDAKDRLGKILGRDRVIPGAAYIANAAVIAPGVISHSGTVIRLVFGERDGARSARAERFLAACLKAGITAELTSNISAELWAKFAFLATFGGVSTVIRKPVGPVLSESVTRQLFADALGEAVAVGRAKGVDLGSDYQAKQMAFCDSLPAETKPSMLIDLERGHPLELEWLSGAVAELGDETGVSTPIHHCLYAALKLYASGLN
jgi:2-dehydropantoate 2-reductase